MKTNVPQPLSPPRLEDGPLPQSHDFNMEAVVANNFGQGDNYWPTDPLNDSRFARQGESRGATAWMNR